MPIVTSAVPYKSSVKELGITDSENATIKKRILRGPMIGRFFLPIFDDAHQPSFGFYICEHNLSRAAGNLEMNTVHLYLGHELPYRLFYLSPASELSPPWMSLQTQAFMRLAAISYLTEEA